jgi:hypothetical protein
MMIAHASIPADDPEAAAKVLADILQGEAMPFPPGGSKSWMAWSKDGEIELEIAPRGHMLHYGAVEGEWRSDGVKHRLSECHLAVCVDRPAQEIIAIAERAGWPVRHCDRGEGIFQLTEVWVEGAFMLEFLDPQQTRIYRERITPEGWRQYLAMMSAA